ncbi:MAG TPA: ABC transporter substrate-binding protein [Gemmatimonadaceae bacterium]|nr:ABC transporter substrate-binding protein [Gemmatimonadaceae bacterium]
MRVLSLLPAGTEIVAALGGAAELVGVTHECDWPPEVTALPRVTTSAVSPGADPAAVDASVRQAAAAGTPLFALDHRRIAALAPDVILTQALCEVCAVSETDVRALVAGLTPPPEVVTLLGTTLDGVLDDITRVAAALGRASQGARLVADLRGRMRRVHDTLERARAPRPRVAVIEWTDPVYAAGHWAPEMVRRAGGEDVLARPGEHSTARTADAVREADPELILFSPCGYAATRAAAEARRTLARVGWEWARGRRVWAVDANGLVSRPGPRLVRGVEVMAAMIAPSLFAAPAADEAVCLTSRWRA